jgi:hypothetical protein
LHRLFATQCHHWIDTAHSPRTVQYGQDKYPGTDFGFWPSLVAFDFRFLTELAGQVFDRFDSGGKSQLADLLYNPEEVTILVDSGKETFLCFLRTRQDLHEKLMFELRVFPGSTSWPQAIQDALKAMPRP